MRLEAHLRRERSLSAPTFRLAPWPYSPGLAEERRPGARLAEQVPVLLRILAREELRLGSDRAAAGHRRRRHGGPRSDECPQGGADGRRAVLREHEVRHGGRGRGLGLAASASAAASAAAEAAGDRGWSLACVPGLPAANLQWGGRMGVSVVAQARATFTGVSGWIAKMQGDK
jgi:hypothetical protein